MTYPKTALVTGCVGFLGRNMTARLLAEGWRVRGIDLAMAPWSDHDVFQDVNFERIICDVADLSADDASVQGIDAVFHFSGLADARPAMDNPLLYLDVNTRSYAQLLESVRAQGSPQVLFASSSAVYGPHDTAMGEDLPCEPANPYGLSKQMSEEIGRHWCKVYGLPVTSLRIYQCYGPGATVGGAMTGFFNRFLAGQSLTVVGDGGQVRDFVHIDDVCEGFLRVATAAPKHDVYNMGTGFPTSILELARMIDPDNIEYLPPRDGDVPTMLADMSRFKSDFGWSPTITAQEGVRRMLEGAK